jgi:hypothetical protein
MVMEEVLYLAMVVFVPTEITAPELSVRALEEMLPESCSVPAFTVVEPL